MPLRLAALLLAPTVLIASETFTGRVVGVADGDTIKVIHEGRAQAIRLHCIDSPEFKQPFGRTAKQLTSSLTFGHDVRVVVKTRDRYRRLVAEVFLPHGKLLNHELVKSGGAWVYVKYCRNEGYYDVERNARERRIGLWQESVPVAPWGCRKQKVGQR